MQIVDPHIHLFNLEQGHYHWLKPENPPHWSDKARINRSFLEADLMLPPAMRLAGFVHIEAGFDNDQPAREIEWLESQVSIPFRTIAFTDITADNFEQQLSTLAKFNTVVGIRHILDDDAKYLLSQDIVQHNLAILASKGLLFEAQLNFTDVAAMDLLLELFDALPSLHWVINHAGFPTANNLSIWQMQLARLSSYQQCFIKLSGWEMTDRHYVESFPAEVTRIVMNTFGQERVMLASNFPVSNLGKPYDELWIMYRDKLGLTPQEFKSLSFKNAVACYQLSL